MIIQHSESDVYVAPLLARSDVGCVVNYGNGTLKLNDYEERQWLYWIYGPGERSRIAYFLQEKIGDELTAAGISEALSDFKSQHNAKCRWVTSSFKWSDLPCYADPERGMKLYGAGHTRVISLQDERELLELIARYPAQRPLILKLQNWFSQYCNQCEYCSLKPRGQKYITSLYENFLMQHGLRLCRFPERLPHKKPRVDKKAAAVWTHNRGDGEICNWHTVLTDISGIFIVTFFFVLAAACFIVSLDVIFKYDVGVLGFFMIPILGSGLALLFGSLALSLLGIKK